MTYLPAIAWRFPISVETNSIQFPSVATLNFEPLQW